MMNRVSRFFAGAAVVGTVAIGGMAASTSAAFADTPPQGSYDPGDTFCDAANHSWYIPPLGWGHAYYLRSGVVQGHYWQSYDVTFTSPGEMTDLGTKYRWC
jgi:hypothetical protein